MTASPAPFWFTSTYSGGSGTECVECMQAGNGILVRDSKNGSGPVVAVRGPAWCAFTRALRSGEMEN
ncbi:DUF397 domain-containing protein [Streptomyces nodosus]|uniref:DUF397 domain-containing protein n=1 Tax=Streptomyces nodosus TaxID=40318 RepID=UPI0036EF3A57